MILEPLVLFNGTNILDFYYQEVILLISSLVIYNTTRYQVNKIIIKVKTSF